MRKNTIFYIALNIVAFSFVGLLLFYLHQKDKAPSAVLAPHIVMGTVELHVGNFDVMENFYRNLLGMQVLSSTKNSVTLGYHKQGVLKLVNAPGLHLPSSADPGLDQIAIVFTTRGGLARALQRVLNQNPAAYLGGTGRGVVGEAFYVNDPAGNTLELYYDTDPSTWPRSSRGNVEGNALPIDSNVYINTYAPHGGNNGMKVGHLQIRIGDITKGKQFYVDIIGFYIVPQLSGSGNSLFLSDGYYHHDLVINEAQGYDGDMASSYQGLHAFEIDIPNISYLSALKKRLSQAGVTYASENNAITFTDPWGITVHVKSPNTPFWQLF